MVTRVYGHVEGVEVIFTPAGNDTWNCTVPKVPDGEYVVDLYAEDEAGNIAYTATILFTIDTKHLKFHVKFLHYDASAKTRDFMMSFIRCEVCGGDMYAIC